MNYFIYLYIKNKGGGGWETILLSSIPQNHVKILSLQRQEFQT